VLDVDDERALKALEAEHEPLPPTVEVVTPRPGRHLWLKGDATNSDSALPAGLHVRGTGGYVLLPPSPHENGVYEWRTAPDEAPIAPAPAWLLQLLQSRANGAGRGEHEARELVPHGQRHPYLKDFAVRLPRGGITDPDRIEAHLAAEFERSCAPLPPPKAGDFRSSLSGPLIAKSPTGNGQPRSGANASHR
jgi:putative DNA primase/helicase